MSKPFTGLKVAIKQVLENAEPNDDVSEPDWPAYVITKRSLEILQAEYNINFVEPEAEQLDVLGTN